MDSHNDELLVDLIAQLVEQCSDILKKSCSGMKLFSILIKQHSKQQHLTSTFFSFTVDLHFPGKVC